MKLPYVITKITSIILLFMVNVGLLRWITGKTAVQQEDMTWGQVAADKVLEKAVTQPLGTYIYRRQVTVTEWVDLRPIFDVFAKETGY